MAKQQRPTKDTHWYPFYYTSKKAAMPLLSMLFSALTLLSFVENTEISLQCENGWTLITPSKRCYKFFNVSQPWYEARSTCISYSAVLAEPIGYDVNVELGKLISNVSSTAKNVWIGYNYINDEVNESSMNLGYWSDWSRESITVALWDINQPSLSSGRCADISQTIKNQWKWRLSPCEEIKPFLCQRTACIQGTFNCMLSGKYSACLNKSKVCNGVPDCPNGFDENNCPEKNRFYIRKDAGTIDFTGILNKNITNGTKYQWTIEGRVGSRIQLSFGSVDALNDFSVLEIWLSGRTIQDSYRYGTYVGTLNRTEYLISNNNFAIIRWTMFNSHQQKNLNITWSSDPDCYWKHVANRSEVNVAPIGNTDLRSDGNINSCLDTCTNTCSIVTVNKLEKKCYFYELVPLVLKSSCCESYVKICPQKSRHSNELSVGKNFKSFHSTTYPLEYSENGHHTWILKAPPLEIITLQFIDIDIDSQASIIVYNGENSGHTVLKKFVRGSEPTTLFSTGNNLAIHFWTGSKSVIRRGFLAKYKLGCDLTVKSDFFRIQSPGYNLSTQYPPRLNCTWKIHSKTQPPALTLKFHPKFGLEKDKDFLQVYNGTMKKEYALFSGKGFTGKTTLPAFHSLSGLFILRFTTNAIVSDIGFQATFSSITYCGALPNLAFGFWKNVSGFYSGHNATYECFENYDNVTANIIYCSNKGTWEPTPKCVVKKCPSPPKGTVKEDNAYRFVCHQYSRLIGYPIVICWKGIWQGNPNCSQIVCENFYRPRNAQEVTPNNVTLYKGDTVNITCATGYKLKGKNPFLCGVHETPTCEVIDKCKINNGGCSHTCTNLPDSYKCGCPKGWELFERNGQLNVSVLPGDTGHDPGDYYRFNHSCIRIICPRPNVKNGLLLRDASSFVFEDSIEILCEEGYQLIGNKTTECLENGKWYSLPICLKATCPPVNSTSGIVDPPGPTNNGDIITINCSLADQVHIRRRRCVWNLQNKTFLTVGDSPECPVTDCGPPKKYPGTVPYQYQCTTLNCSFNFTCLPSFNRTGNGNGTNNQTVICGNNGYWMFNDLACKGSTCKDPGRPADGEQHGDSYEEGSLITFSCFRPGFKLSNPYPLKCLYNGSLNWNATVPQCVDKEKPKILNCSTTPLQVERMAELNISVPEAIDNSGEFIKVEVVPIRFRKNQVIFTDMNITFTAVDSANNSATCSFQIKLKDFEKPKLSCPNITTHLLYESVSLSKENFTVNASDNSGRVSLTYEPKTLEIGKEVNATYVIKVTATDPSNNTEMCYIQVKTEDVPNTQCDERRLLIPNANITCQKIGSNISCNVTCTKGTLFFDQPAVYTRVLTCNPLKGWETEGIYCVPPQKTAYQVEIYIAYNTKNQTCVQTYLEKKWEDFRKNVTNSLNTEMTKPVIVAKPTVGNLETVSTKVSGDKVNAILRVELIASWAKPNIYNSIANTNILKVYGELFSKKFNIPCGNIVNVTSRIGFLCKSAGQVYIVNQKAICVTCPPGMYGKDFRSCLPCAENTYNSESNKTQCTTCPPDTYINKKGSRSVHSCYSKCPPGFYSADGLIPCMPCPEQTYSYNRTWCKSCSPGKKTSNRGAGSESDCKTECKPGNYSQTGFEPCTLCPENTFSEHHGAKMCEPCDERRFIKMKGSANRTDCKVTQVCSGNICENGTCHQIHDEYYCDCPNGFKGRNCTEVINPCLSNPCFYNQTCSQINNTNNYNCTCNNGFHGLRCEQEEDSCKTNSTCQNAGVCKDLVGGYKCLCPSWSHYTGSRCDKKVQPCLNNTCRNNGSCVPTGLVNGMCVCQPGFKGDFCEEDIDDCISDPCENGGKCIDNVNNFTCQCRKGFKGRFCEIIDDPCKTGICGKNRICIRNYFNNTFYCICVKNFIPNPQNKNECIAEDHCLKSPCKNNGTCSPLPEPFNCTCPSGYKGSRCHIRLSECTNSSSCKNGAVCRKIGSKNICACKAKVINGTRCTEPIDYCIDSHCKPEGTHNCISQSQDYKCNCSKGFSGRYCQTCDLPCLHGECIKQGGNITCKCNQGWKGENCSELINQCDSNPCQNNGKCFGNFIDFHCECPPGFQNKTCNEPIDFCEQANHCIGNGSLCKNDATHATCVCAKGHGGIGCQNTSPCTPTTCKNGGTCEVRGNKINCICPMGFAGESCNMTTDPCDTFKDCDKSQCERQGQQAFCKCGTGKIGRRCKQDVFFDVDLVFPRSKGFMQPTPIPKWNQLSQNFLTMTFWIKYYLPIQKTGLTTSLVLYGTDTPDGKSQISELLSLKKDKLMLSFSEIETFNLTGVDDGRWHHVIVTWSGSNVAIYFDFELVISNEYGRDKTLPTYGVLIPAGIIDQSTYLVKPSEFAGRISRFVLLNSTWTAEKVKNLRNNVTQVLQDILLDFYRSVLNMANVLLEFPSEINQNICELNTKCTQIRTSRFPTVDMCPHAQMKVASRWEKLDWVQPKFTHNSTVASNYVPGKSYFDWGQHTITYIAFGEKNETSAVCTFQVFSRRFSCQQTISDTYLNSTERNCQVKNESIICTPNCNGQNKHQAIPGPLVYSCGVSNMWGKEETSRLTFPSCAKVTSVPKVNIQIEMTMEFKGAQPTLSNLCGEVQKSLESFLLSHSLCPQKNCSTCFWKSTNPVRKRRSLSNPPVKANLNNVNSTLANGISTKDQLLFEIIRNKTFNYKTLNASASPGSVRITLSCAAGQVLIGQTCAVLQSVPGTYLDNANKQIKACPKGTYQPKSGQSSCIQCNLGKTTIGELSVSKNECKAMCVAGSYFSSTDNKCIVCGIGFYQNKKGHFLCDGCPDGKVTAQEGSTSPDQCIKPETTTVFIPLRTLSPGVPAGTAAVTRGGLNARDIAIIVVVSLLVILFLLCILLFCCRTKIRKIIPCLAKNKVANAPEQKDRYSKSNVKMVSYNLTNIRERRMGAGNDPKSYPQRNDYPESTNDNNSDVSSSLDGSMQYFLPDAKRQPADGTLKELNPENPWLSNGDSLLQMHQQPRIGVESVSGGQLIKAKPKRPKNNVVKVHLSNFPRKEPKIMVDSDEEDVR